jgi:putative SOS response-associated peptidase YedK
VDDAPNDDEEAYRETFNFPPGAYGLIYRAEVPDSGVRDVQNQNVPPAEHENEEAGGHTTEGGEEPAGEARDAPPNSSQTQPTNFKYELKAMKWGLIPFWTKRSPDYSSMLRTINCRDDSLIENKGMWTTMKQRKRCIVIAQGFYEWLKKDPSGKQKIPHFVKRKDGKLMCFAGLWDCAKYDDSEEKLYTYTVITTDSNKQLNFLHDRMPVILNAGSEEMRTWLDPTRNTWSKELQSLLKPFEGELECYPVDQAVGKVGNNSANFIIPVDSKENKKNIANFFGNAAAKKASPKKEPVKIEEDPDEIRKTVDHEGTEDNAPLPIPKTGEKRGADIHSDEKAAKAIKLEDKTESPTKPKSGATRSATSNQGLAKKTRSPMKKDGTQAITNFFGK